MPISGDLSTMSLADLLQWASVNQKTGVLEVERNKICRRVEFRKGWIGACATDDPPGRLGQFLLSRGKIDRATLRRAMESHERTGDSLALILMQLGVLTQVELGRLVAARAEETIQGLFDWEDAVFRFHDGATLEPNQIEINLSAQELILRGMKHREELDEIRRVFPSSGAVLRRTATEAPSQVLDRAIARRIVEAIDGRRTIAELLLHAHASAFLVLRLLYRLNELGLIAIDPAAPSVDPEYPTILDVPGGRRARPSGWDTLDLADLGEGPGAASAEPAVDAAATVAADDDEGSAELEAELEVARRLVNRREYTAALELLNASYRAHPAESSVRRLIFRTEREFVETVRVHPLAPDKVPRLLPAAEDVSRSTLSPEEAYLLSLLDGRQDIRAILWLAPLREVDALRALHRMLDRELIELADRAAVA